jgi:hypothetical protein
VCLQDEIAKLHRLAGRVRRTTFGGRWDPESALIERDEIASELIRVAQALERQNQTGEWRRPLPTKSAMPSRAAALLISQKQRIALLEAQLAQAIRPRPRRRQRSSNDQLSLPLPEEPNGPNQ